MRLQILLAFTALLFMSCNKPEERYTQQSAEINSFKQSVDDYRNYRWEDLKSHYADTAKIANNVIEEKAINISEHIESSKKDAEMFDWKIENEEYEMVVTDEGETWVNFWGVWKGTMKATNKEYVIPYHSTAQFVSGKIVKEFGYWNNSEISTDLMKAEKETTMDEGNAEVY
ncbi:MAG: nuclear transport factor 2 family protein [Psychroserpens sp.]|uniref:nuclear transport factor 2 family protein n=1 Tax=Psychroserpens sp. TaxID=2020870 RepID=UPI003C77E6AC